MYWKVGRKQLSLVLVCFCSAELASVFLCVVAFGRAGLARGFSGVGNTVVGSIGLWLVKPALKWPVVLLVAR